MLTVQVIAFIAGSVFILIAIIGGGFIVKEFEFPTVPKTGRIVSGIVGVLFISVSILMAVIPILPAERSPGERSADASVPHREEAIYLDDAMATSPDGIKVSRIRALSQNDPPRVNDRITIHFSLQNVEREPVALKSIFIGARDPAKKNIDFGHINYETVLAPNQMIDIKNSTFVTEGGVWKFWPCYMIGDTFCPDEWRGFRVLVEPRQ